VTDVTHAQGKNGGMMQLRELKWAVNGACMKEINLYIIVTEKF
jgi:hypothetical protein